MKNHSIKTSSILHHMDAEFRDTITKAAEILRKKFDDGYVPMENVIPNAWDYPNNEWA